MGEYNTFNHKNSKLNEIWDRSKNNIDKINNIPLLRLDFNSINFNKEIITIPVIENQLITSLPITKIQTILLENFPEWALNMIEPNITYTIADGYIGYLIDTTLSEAFTNGTLKNDDVGINLQNFKYWFNNVDQINFLLKIFYSISISQAIVSGVGFSSKLVPTYVDISLKLYNHRIYETMNEKFE